MAFHSCASDCGNPANHTVRLAGSDDGLVWTTIDAFEPFAGSVPDLGLFDGFLYLFHAGGTGSNVKKLNACFEVVDEISASLSSATDTGGWVDPALFADEGSLFLFYLPGIIGQDPAGCSSYPCTKEIHSAENDDASLSAFTQVTGARAAVEISSGTFSDPDVIQRSSDYLLYVSMGPSVAVFVSSSLNGTYASPDDPGLRSVSDGSGGVPSAFVSSGGDVWLYVTKNQAGTEVIRRGVTADGITVIADGDFDTVVDGTVLGDASLSVSSPSVIAWPDASWSRQTATTRRGR